MARQYNGSICDGEIIIYLTLAVSKELVDQRHQVYYHSFDSVKEQIKNIGAKFVYCDLYLKLIYHKYNQKYAVRIFESAVFFVKFMADLTLS